MQQQLQLADGIQHAIEIGIWTKVAVQIEARRIEAIANPTYPSHADLGTR